MTVYTGYTTRPCTKSHRSCAFEISSKHNVQPGDSAPRTNRSKRAIHLDLPSNAVAAGFIQNRPTVVSITFFPIFVFYPLFVVYALLYNMCIMYKCIACWPRAVNEKKKIKKIPSKRTNACFLFAFFVQYSSEPCIREFSFCLWSISNQYRVEIQLHSATENPRRN